MARTLKRVAIAVIGLLIITGALGGIKALQISRLMAQADSFSPPPETVGTAEVTAATWVPQLTAVGSVEAVRGVMVSAEVAGMVRQITFRSGSDVRKGQLLVRLDTETEEAQLAAAVATAELAEADLARAERLREAGVNAGAELDAAQARARQTAAQVENLRSILQKKTILAPFSGRVGIRKVDIGEYLSPGAPIVSLQSADPIYVIFALPQQQLGQVDEGQGVKVSTDAFEGAEFEGKITTIDPQIDASTRNVTIQATLANEDGRLRGGMFVDVTVMLPEERQVVVIPATAVKHAPYGDSVFVVEEEKDEKTGESRKVARQRFVRIGERRGDLAAVISGVKPGETAVTAGAFKLRNGSPVVINNDVDLSPEMRPQPDDA